jgi:hypothetical protein
MYDKLPVIMSQAENLESESEDGLFESSEK